MFTPDTRASKITEIPGEIDTFTILLGDLNTLMSVINKFSRQNNPIQI